MTVEEFKRLPAYLLALRRSSPGCGSSSDAGLHPPRRARGRRQLRRAGGRAARGCCSTSACPLAAAPRRAVPLPAVPGLADGADPTLLGVVVSHGHLDHYGPAPRRLTPDVPVYVGRGDARGSSPRRRSSPLPGSSLQPGRVPARPRAAAARPVPRHAVPGRPQRLRRLRAARRGRRPAAVLQRRPARARPQARRLPAAARRPAARRRRAPARGHPDHGRRRRRPLDASPRPTSSWRSRSASAPPTGLALVLASAQNLDRLVTVYRAARRARRTLVVDLYTATLARATGRGDDPAARHPRRPRLRPQPAARARQAERRVRARRADRARTASTSTNSRRHPATIRAARAAVDAARTRPRRLPRPGDRRLVDVARLPRRRARG